MSIKNSNCFQNYSLPAQAQNSSSVSRKETLAVVTTQIQQENAEGRLEAICYVVEELRAADSPHQRMTNFDLAEILRKQGHTVEPTELRQIISASEVAQKDFFQGSPLDFGNEKHKKAFHFLIDVQQGKSKGYDPLCVIDAENKLDNFYPEINNAKKEDVSRSWAFKVWRQGTSELGIGGRLVVFGVDELLQTQELKNLDLEALRKHGYIGSDGFFLTEKIAELGTFTLDDKATGLLHHSRYHHLKEGVQDCKQSLKQAWETQNTQGQILLAKVEGLAKRQQEEQKKQEALEEKRSHARKRANVTNTLKAVNGVCTVVNDSVERIHHIKDAAKHNRDRVKQTTRFSQQELQRHMRPLSSQPVNYLEAFSCSTVSIQKIDTLLGEIQEFIEARETLIASGMDQAGHLQETIESIQERYLEINKLREKERKLFEYISLPLNAIGAALSAFPVTAPYGAGVQIIGQGARAIGAHSDRKAKKIEDSYEKTGRQYQEVTGILGGVLSSNRQAAHSFASQKAALQQLKLQKLKELGEIDEYIQECQTQKNDKIEEIQKKETDQENLEKENKDLKGALEAAEAHLSKKSNWSASGKKAQKKEADQAKAQAEVDRIKALITSNETETGAVKEEIKSLKTKENNLQEDLEKNQNNRNLIKGHTQYLKQYETLISLLSRSKDPDDPTQKALDQYAQVEQIEQALQGKIASMCMQTSRFVLASDEFFGRDDSASVHKSLAVASKSSQLLGSLHKLAHACRLLKDFKKDRDASDSGGSVDLGTVVKLGAMFANPASSTMIIGMELACLLFQDPQKEANEAQLFKDLCKDLKGLPAEVKEINKQLCKLNQAYEKISKEINVKIDLLIDYIPSQIESLKATTETVTHRQTALQKFEKNRHDMMAFTLSMSDYPSYMRRDLQSRALDPIQDRDLITQMSDQIESAFNKLQSKIEYMRDPGFNGVWLCNLQSDTPEYQPKLMMVRSMLASREPAHYTGFLAEQMSLDASYMPSLYQYEQLAHVFVSLSSKILLDAEFPTPPKGDIVKYSSLLIKQGLALGRALSTQMVERAFSAYEITRRNLIVHLNGQLSTSSIQEAQLPQDPTFELNLNFSKHDARGELLSLKSLPFRLLLRGRPRLASLYDKILDRQIWDDCGLDSGSVSNKFSKNVKFYARSYKYKDSVKNSKDISPLLQVAFYASGISEEYDAMESLRLKDQKIYESRKNFLENIRFKSDEQLVPRSLSFKDVLKGKIITREQRDLIKGNFLEVAFRIYSRHAYYFDSSIRLWTNAETYNPLHRFVDFHMAVSTDCWIPGALNKSLNPHYPDDFFFSIIHAENFQSHAGLVGKEFVLLSPFFNTAGLFNHRMQQLGYLNNHPFELNHIPYTPMPTSPDGACALHALLGTLTSDKGYYMKGVREYFVKRLCLRMQEYRSSAQQVPPHLKAIKELLQQIIKEYLDRAVDPLGNDLSSQMLFPRDKKGFLLSIPHSSYDEWAWMPQGDATEFRKPQVHESKQQEHLSADSDFSDVDEVIEVEASSFGKSSFSEVQSILEGIENLDDIEEIGDTKINEDIHEWVYLPIFQFMLDLGKSEQPFIKQRIKTLLLGSGSESRSSESKRFFERARKYLSEYGPIDTLTNLQVKTYCAAALKTIESLYAPDEAKEHYLISVMRKTTLLHMAASEGSIDLVVLILEKGVEINIRDKDGRTSLERAVINGHSDVALLLMLYRADDASVLNVHQILSQKNFQADQQTVSMYSHFSKAVNALAPEANRLHLAIDLHNTYTKNPSLLKSVKIAILFLSRTTLIHQADAAGNLPIDMLDQMNFPIHLKHKDDKRILPVPEETIGKETLEKMPKAFWEILDIPKERVVGIKIAKCWQLLKAAQQKAREMLKEKEAELWLKQLDKVLSTVMERVKKAKPQHPLYKKTEEQVLKMLDEEPRLLLNIVCTEYEEFFKLLEDGESKKAIEDAKIEQKDLSDKQEEQLNTFALSEAVYERYLSTAMRETQSDKDLGFYFNTQEIHLAALLFDKKVQVVSTQEDGNGVEGVFPSENAFNPHLPGDPIVIYHKGNHFERCIPFSQIEKVPVRKAQAQKAKSPMDTMEYNDAIKKLVDAYQAFLVLNDKPNSKNPKTPFDSLKSEGSLLSPFKKEHPRLFFPNDLLKKIEEKHSLEELHKILATKKKGVVQRYYHFALSQDERCYELRICYRVMKQGDDKQFPQEHSYFVVAEIGVNTVGSFSHLPMSAFLIQAMYTDLSTKPVLPGELSFKILHNMAESVIPIEEPFEGLFRKLKTPLKKPKEATEGKKQKQQVLVKEEEVEKPLKRVLFNYRPDRIERLLDPGNTISLTPAENHALIEKERFVMRETLIADVEKNSKYIEAEQARFLLISLVKLSTGDPKVLKRIESKTSPNLFSSVVETESETARLKKDILESHKDKPSISRQRLEVQMKNLTDIHYYAKGQTKNRETPLREICSRGESRPFLYDYDDEKKSAY